MNQIIKKKLKEKQSCMQRDLDRAPKSKGGHKMYNRQFKNT